jgi:serine-type D-Ala-D-Ala carboxypeptidase (penicillin-binding protein 5/6)
MRSLVVRQIITVWVLALVTALPAHAAHRHAQGTVTARAAILIDNDTGQVLWQRNPDVPLPPASTTKIVTAMLALQSGRLDDSFSVTAEAAEAPPSKISLRPGWKMRLRDLVYALLLNSANDASVVIAEGLSGSVRDFAERMNAEARALGAINTHFVNPNGLPAADHYSTARDLATMFGHAMRNPLFQNIVSTKTTSVFPTAGSFRRIALRNHNRLLGSYRIQVVGKTGWTIAAKKCFVGAGTANGRELGVAVLGSTDLWGDLKRLLEFGFDGGYLPEADVAGMQPAPAMVSAAAGDNDDGGVALAPPAERYFVGLGTFAGLGTATRVKRAVARSGYPVRVEKLRGRKSHYRVLVGSYAKRRDAERISADLHKQHKWSTAVIVIQTG